MCEQVCTATIYYGYGVIYFTVSSRPTTLQAIIEVFRHKFTFKLIGEKHIQVPSSPFACK